MQREQKAAVIEEIAANISESDAVFVVDPRGLTVSQSAELRTRLRATDTRLSVVKNTLTLRAADRAGAEALKDVLAGPTALAYVRGDAAAAAKALRDYGRETELVALKGGMMDGAAVSPEEILAIAQLPSREILYAQLVNVVAYPISGLARTLNQLIGGLAIALGQVKERGLVSGEAPATTPAPEPSVEAEETADAAAASEADASAVPDEAGTPPGDADADAGAETPAEGDLVTGEDPDPDAGPASTPGPSQPDQAEGDDAQG